MTQSKPMLRVITGGGDPKPKPSTAGLGLHHIAARAAGALELRRAVRPLGFAILLSLSAYGVATMPELVDGLVRADFVTWVLMLAAGTMMTGAARASVIIAIVAGGGAAYLLKTQPSLIDAINPLILQGFVVASLLGLVLKALSRPSPATGSVVEDRSYHQ